MATEITHADNSNVFPQAYEKQHLQEMDIIKMAASNAEPAGKIPGPKSAHTHAPYSAGKPADSAEVGKAGPGQGSTKGINPGKTGANKNRLH